ncbi:Uncharacterised protein [Streptococcus porcinus]|uniref:hypothetical protein n=1 Tax=Streptococcus porcinus TaxID=1340 RepID=UPI0010CABBDC|nr:hypothetical protein [Streptococcus porcinus]VTS26442.1 Uncharacterised protein [Streptococcus porcinus]
MEKTICDIAKKYVMTSDIDKNVNIYGILQPIDVVCFLEEIAEIFKLEIDLDFINKTKILSINNLCVVIEECIDGR